MKISMHDFGGTVSKKNVDQAITEYVASVERLGESVTHLKGLDLLIALKREIVGIGPYPNVTLFEAANRIMTDLVILYGLRWLLNHRTFPFDSYTVEYGHGNKQGFDIRACADGRTLIGEAFNVAPSFFQTKKSDMLRKLRSPSATADFKIVMFNDDAVRAAYLPKPRNNEFFVSVKVGTDEARVFPDSEKRGPSLSRSSIRQIT
jgi:hypothetical protein